jgi:peptidoglycan hydrolase-like protein with peptidoglycan-binding domain
MAALLAFTPVNVSAATLLKQGSKGSEVTAVQTNLKELGYYTYSKTTGYYGKITVSAVKSFQKDNGLYADGIVGKRTRALLEEKVSDSENKTTVAKTTAAKTVSTLAVATVTGSAISAATATGSAISVAEASGIKVLTVADTDSDHVGALDWFKEVRYIWDRGENATVTDVETGLSFQVKRTYGTNHADVEPLTKEDTETIKEIWGGFSWDRRAVVVQIGNYTIAASMTAMPHAGVDSKPADQYVSNRSAGYGRGINLDKVKDNGCNGHMDIHFKNSKTHTTNRVLASQQSMVKKAADFIVKLIWTNV